MFLCILLYLHTCLTQVLEDVATCLVANGLMVQAQAQQNDSKKYMAVYSLITAYLDITPEQDYIASAKRVSTVLLCVWVLIRKAIVELFSCVTGHFS